MSINIEKIINNPFDRKQKGIVAALCIVLLLSFQASSCSKDVSDENEKEEQKEEQKQKYVTYHENYAIYENHAIPVCGVDDPLRNLDWLAEFINNESTTFGSLKFDIMIRLYRNIKTEDEKIVIFYIPLVFGDDYKTPDPYSLEHVFTCSGEMVSFDSNETLHEFIYHSGGNVSREIIWYGFHNHDIYAYYKVYENRAISACGVDDPLRNLDWLAMFTAENRNPVGFDWDIRIELYANKYTQIEAIVISYSINFICTEDYCEEPPDPYYANQIYTCKGIKIVDEEWDEVFYSGKYSSKGIIWRRYNGDI